MNRFHEVAMLSAKLWGEANAQLPPEQFGHGVSIAYTAAFDVMESGQDFSDALAYGVSVPEETISSEALMNILTKRAK